MGKLKDLRVYEEETWVSKNLGEKRVNRDGERKRKTLLLSPHP